MDPQIFVCKEKLLLSLINFSDERLLSPIKRRNKPIFYNKEMSNGNVPLDGGALKVEESELENFKDCPYMKRLLGGEELLHNKKRYVIWLVNVSEVEIARFPKVAERVKQCQINRLKMSASSKKYALSPTLFRDTNNPQRFLAIPVTWSTQMKYIPIMCYGEKFIPTNQVQILPNFDLYEFGVLASSVHSMWAQIVYERNHCQKCYAKDVIYNNFPWPDPSDKQRHRIKSSAEKLLEVLLKYSQKYSVDEMMQRVYFLPELEKAYEDNDNEVKKAYRSNGWTINDDFQALLIRSYCLADTVLMLNEKVFGLNKSEREIDYALFLLIAAYLEGRLTKEQLFDEVKKLRKSRKFDKELMGSDDEK